jgi:hypothetical protein
VKLKTYLSGVGFSVESSFHSLTDRIRVILKNKDYRFLLFTGIQFVTLSEGKLVKKCGDFTRVPG